MEWRVKAGTIPPAPGMLDADGYRVMSVYDNGKADDDRERWWVGHLEDEGDNGLDFEEFRPDVTDPATAYLCLLWAAEVEWERLPEWVLANARHSRAAHDAMPRYWSGSDTDAKKEAHERDGARYEWRQHVREAMLAAHCGGPRVNQDIKHVTTVESVLRALNVVEDV